MLLESALAMKKGAEHVVERMNKRGTLSPGNRGWVVWTKMPKDWNIPEIKLSTLNMRVDNQEYNISE